MDALLAAAAAHEDLDAALKAVLALQHLEDVADDLELALIGQDAKNELFALVQARVAAL